MTRILLHHPRAGRRLTLRRGLEAAGFDVEVVESPDAVEGSTPEAVLVVAADAPAFREARAAGRLGAREVVVVGDDPTARCVPEDAPVDALVDILRGGAPGEDPTPDPSGASSYGLVHGGGLDEVVARIERLAAVDLPVLVTGESGVGKEVVARALHDGGPRRDEPFVVLSVGATSAELLESELFGHVRGAFTDAVADRVGRLEAAADGTLVLDEIADVPVGLQATFLRVLQDRRFSRVGETTERTFRARIVTTTSRDLARAVAGGTFREDLYHRLAGAVVRVPPLRERPEDVPVLAQVLLARQGRATGRQGRLSEAAAARLAEYSWPGNVRELDHVLQRASLLSEGELIDVVHVETTLAGASETDPDSLLTDALRRWIEVGRARGASWTSLRQRLDEILRSTDEEYGK